MRVDHRKVFENEHVFFKGIQSCMPKHLEHLIQPIHFRSIWSRMLFYVGPQHTAGLLSAKQVTAFANDRQHILSQSIIVELIDSFDDVLFGNGNIAVTQPPYFRVDLVEPIDGQTSMGEHIRNTVYNLPRPIETNPCFG